MILTAREIFNRILRFQPCPRTLKWEFGYWAGTLKRWYEEGLPIERGIPDDCAYGEPVPGTGVPWGQPIAGVKLFQEHDVRHHFGLDDGLHVLPYHYWLFPAFERRIVREDEQYIELCDFDGIRKKSLKDASSMPLWLEWPVRTRKDWERVKEEHFNPKSINKRFDDGILARFHRDIENRDYPLSLFYYPIGFFGSIRYLVGDMNLFLLYYDDPNLVQDILGHLCDLWIAMAEEALGKYQVDIACFWEDMSYKNGPLIGPDIYRHFMKPCYLRLIDFLRAEGVQHFALDTDGNVSSLIPLLLESGINGLFPFEQQAGNDLLKIRKMFPQLIMMGGFDKNTLTMGKEAIDLELQKMAVLIHQGGYIPFADHLIPPNSTWENFKYYRTRLNEIVESTPIGTDS